MVTSMSLQCTATADCITSVLLAGDAILNLSSQSLKVAAGIPFVSVSGGRLTLTSVPFSVCWNSLLAASLNGLLSDDVLRLVVVSEDGCPAAAEVLRLLQSRGLPHCHCVLAGGCDAESFMDDEDAEAVAERLRQLGYL